MGNNNQNNGNSNSQLNGNEIPFIVVLVGAAVVWKYHREMEAWFNDNLIMIALSGAACLLALGYFIVLRMEKNGKEKFERMRNVSQNGPGNKSQNSYYDRRKSNDGSDY